MLLIGVTRFQGDNRNWHLYDAILPGKGYGQQVSSGIGGRQRSSRSG